MNETVRGRGRPRMLEQGKFLSLYLEERQVDTLRRIAEREQQSVSAVARRILAEHLREGTR